MVFWLICVLVTLVVAATMVRPFLRGAPMPEGNPDVALYKAQLEEIDRDVARNLLAEDEAERAKAEVARRLIAASKAEAAASGPQAAGIVPAVVMVLVMAAVSFAAYFYLGAPGYGDLPLKARLAASDEMRANRPDQAALVAATPPAPVPENVPEEYRAAVIQLRTLVPTRPDDLQGWELLSLHEAELRNYDAAAAAQARVIEIKGEEATVADQVRLLDLMVVAAGGLVSPEAEVIVGTILDADPDNVAARYYGGALYNQTDRPDLALRFWRDIVEAGDPRSFHVASARAQISDAARRAGVQYALPETRGPSFAEMDEAQQMSPEDREAMIGGMVTGLANRLATEGGPPQDWARLIRAYGVLGETQAARTVWAEAQQVFVGSMRGMEILTDAAREAGVLE